MALVRGTCCHIYLSVAFKANHKGWRATHSLPNKLLQVREHCIISMLSLETSMTMSSDSLYKISCREIAQCELTVPPSNPLLMTGYTHQAVDSPRKMTRRSPFQEGEGGVHRGNPPQSQSNQLGEGFPLDHHNNHHVLLWQDQTWGS